MATASGRNRRPGAGKPAPTRKSRAVERPRAGRLDPAVRKDLILDHAAQIITKTGLSSCSLDAVAISANVSKPLVYKYFPNREALLIALLQREFDDIRGRNITLVTGRKPADATEDMPVEDLLKAEVRHFLEYLLERGNLFRTLVNDPSIADPAKVTLQSGRGAIMKFWTERLNKAYGIPIDLVRVGVIMASHALEGAEGSIRSGKIDIDSVADFWTTFITAGWRAVGARYRNHTR